MDADENVAASRDALVGDNTALWALLARLVDRPDPRATAPQPRNPEGF